VSAADQLHRLSRRYYAYLLKLFEHEQVILSRHGQIGLCGQRTSQHGIISIA